MVVSPQAIDIGPWQLALGLLLILLAQALSWVFRLGLVRDLAVGTLRTFVQLTVMGYALKFLFGLSSVGVMIGVFACMIAAGAHTIRGRVRERRVPFTATIFWAMFGSYLLVTVLVTGVVIGAKPWWQPQYFIPIGGMVIGNSMNSLALSLERLLSELKARRAEVEMRLALGADAAEASGEIVREALRAGMIPAINSMMAVGLVFLPGMMTGQILAGADPLQAIRYQIVVMLMLAASSALGSTIVVLIVRRRAFSRGLALRV